MNNFLMSTRGTANSRRNVGILFSAIMILMGIFIVVFYCYANTRTHNDRIGLILFLGLFLICDGFIMTTKNFINGSTYVDVYEDRFVGKGMQGMSLQTFNIKNEQISDVTVEGIWLHIQINGGIYKVMTDKKTADAIFNYSVRMKG